MSTSTPHRKLFLVILDGFGLAEKERGNAILTAGMPYLESLMHDYPAYAIAASGLVVGLPWGQQGNSEVGHSAIGTGRIIIQDLAHINGEIRSGDFFKNTALREAFDHAKKHDSAIHFMGCTSPGGIHSHVDHLIALLEMAKRERVERVFVHFIADGQDMPPQDAVNVLNVLERPLKKAKARIASIQGRSYAMDRVLNWKLAKEVWDAVVLGKGEPIEDVEAYLKQSYKQGLTDYSLEPATVMENGQPVGIVNDNDAFIFFDFRNDRVRQLATPFIVRDFDSFDRVRTLKNVKVITMTKYDEEFKVPVAYPAPKLDRTLGEIVSEKGWKQWRIAEKEKEAHVTNFFNGGRITSFRGEERDILPSRKMKGKEYAEHPEMSAGEIVSAVREHADDSAKLYVINFANPDMVAHSGDLKGTVKAMGITDECLRKLIEPLRKDAANAVIITADHGNAEELLDPMTKGEDTQHSTRNVPAVFIAEELKGSEGAGKDLEALAQEAPVGSLVDIAPTVLQLLGLHKPAEMTGSSLVTPPKG